MAERRYVGKCVSGPLDGDWLVNDQPRRYVAQRQPVQFAFEPIVAPQPIKAGFYQYRQARIAPEILYSLPRDDWDFEIARQSIWVWHEP